MQLLRKHIPRIAKDLVTRLVEEGAIEVREGMGYEAELDLAAILIEWANAEDQVNREAHAALVRRGLGADRFDQVRRDLSRANKHATGDDAPKHLVELMVEELMKSRHIEEVFAADYELRAKIRELFYAATGVVERAPTPEADADAPAEKTAQT
ncbi:DUF507 family protein [Myxococcota bacterium]|nr:DUF507 family protein [Myxococcota bacterium]